MYIVQTRLNSNDADLEKVLNKLDTDGYDIITISISHQSCIFRAVIVAKKRDVKEYLGPG